MKTGTVWQDYGFVFCNTYGRFHESCVSALFHCILQHLPDLGVIVPKMNFHAGESLENDEFRVQLNDLWFPSIQGLQQDQFLVSDTVDKLATIDVVGERTISSLTNSEGALIQGEESAVTCQNAGFTIWPPSDFIRQCIVNHITRNVGAFLTTDSVKYNLNVLQRIYPALLEPVLLHLDARKLIRTLRNLLDEELSIRNLLPMLEALLAINGTTALNLSRYRVLAPSATNLCPVTEEKKVEDIDAAEYSDYLRTAFKRYVSYKHTMGDNILYAYRLDAHIEGRIADISSHPLNDEEHRQLMKAIFDETQKPKSIDADPVILTDYALRRRLRSIVEKEYPWLEVMCFEELSPYVDLKILSEISWS